MKKVLLFSAVIIAAVISGCTTYYRDAGADFLPRPEADDTARYYTEYEFDKSRISAKGNASVLFGIFQIAENKRCLSVINPHLSLFSMLNDLISPTFKAVSNAKSVALYNACEQNNADQLLGVTFDYTIKDYLIYAEVDCTVKGYPARVKGIQKIEKKPIVLNKWQKIEYVAPYEYPKTVGPQPKESLSLLDTFK